MRLLIADDEINLAKALQAVLEDAGYNCDVCFDGNSAIRLISQENGYSRITFKCIK